LLFTATRSARTPRGVCVILFIGAKHVGKMTTPPQILLLSKNTNSQSTQCKQKT